MFISSHRLEPPQQWMSTQMLLDGRPPSAGSTRSSAVSRWSDDSVSRRSSVTSYSTAPTADYESVPTLTKTPWELERSKRMRSQKIIRPPAAGPLNPRIFKTLPREIYDCILVQLEGLHLVSGSKSCSICLTRDFCSLSLTSRAWDRAARQRLYRSIEVPTDDLPMPFRRTRPKKSPRMKLLRRTLRERTPLAKLICELKISHGRQRLEVDNSYQAGGFLDQLASLVMACPNLQRLQGFYPEFPNEFDRLSHALSTRPFLKEKVWIARGREMTPEELELYEEEGDPWPPGVGAVDADLFLSHHERWSELQVSSFHMSCALQTSCELHLCLEILESLSFFQWQRLLLC